MAADELGSIYTGETVKIHDGVTRLGKEADRRKKEHPQKDEPEAREEDSVTLHGDEHLRHATVEEHAHDDEDEPTLPGQHIDLTVR